MEVVSLHLFLNLERRKGGDGIATRKFLVDDASTNQMVWWVAFASIMYLVTRLSAYTLSSSVSRSIIASNRPLLSILP